MRVDPWMLAYPWAHLGSKRVYRFPLNPPQCPFSRLSRTFQGGMSDPDAMWVVLLKASRPGSGRDRDFDPSFVVVERVRAGGKAGSAPRIGRCRPTSTAQLTVSLIRVETAAPRASRAEAAKR